MLGTGTFKDSMMGSVFTVLQATAFNGVGDIGKKFDLPESGAYKIALHAVVGGFLSEEWAEISKLALLQVQTRR